MSRKCLVQMILVLNLLVATSWAISPQDQQTILQRVLHDAIDSNDTFGTTFAVSNGDGSLFLKASSGTMSENTQYSLASISKMYTCTMIYKLREKGLLHLEDKAWKYLGSEVMDSLEWIDGMDYSKEITIRQLLSHTSGLPDYWTERIDSAESLHEMRRTKDFSYSDQDALRIVRRLKPHFKPGEAGNGYYSDTNYLLLGLIIEKITGKSLAVVYRKQIFEPLKLKNTYVCETGKFGKFAPFYYQGKPQLRPKVLASDQASAGIVSNTAEVTQFLKAYFSGSLFPKEYLSENQQWNPIQYVPLQYGWGLMKLGNMIGHSGATGTVAYYLPESDVFIVGATGQLDAEKAMMLTVKIAQSLGYKFRM